VPDDCFTTFTAFGPGVTVGALAYKVVTTLPGGRYGELSGTSMASPMATEAIAVYLAERPGGGLDEVKRYLAETAEPAGERHTADPEHREPVLRVSADDRYAATAPQPVRVALALVRRSDLPDGAAQFTNRRLPSAAPPG
jgi:subtilisin family serine protease